jgi:hypothetical protein
VWESEADPRVTGLVSSVGNSHVVIPADAENEAAGRLLRLA